MTHWLQTAEKQVNMDRVTFFEEVLLDQISNKNITLACGQWDKGGIMELVPRGQASLLPSKYSGSFAGIRELRIKGVEHHLHIDLGRIHSIEFRITPSVCLNFRPSFEVCFISQASGGGRTGISALTVMLSYPYKGSEICLEAVQSWLEQYFHYVSLRSDLVRLVIDSSFFGMTNSSKLNGLLEKMTRETFDNLREAVRWVTRNEYSSKNEPQLPNCKTLIEDAMALKDASLVIFRDRTLVEFKTEDLGGLFEYREGPHKSWQLGRQDSHHCHLDLKAVSAVEFSAEPVSCQRGRLNYTVWFLVPGGCGNTFRSDGYFSFTLNRPYRGNEPRWEVIEPIFQIYKKYKDYSWVKADKGFLEAIETFYNYESMSKTGSK
ncbi:MAG: hypothetical protein HRT44_01070 [Bdellovibrionales bacterium]|nr:hypothetical protein [Bdellovibrionales bacterium]